MKIFRLALCLILLLPHVSLAQIGAKAREGKIDGIWSNNEMGFQMILMLNPDGTGEFDGEAIRYVVKGTNITITGESGPNTYAFKLESNSLTVSGGDLDKPMTFTRNGATNTPGVGKPNDAKPVSTGTSHAKDLIGTWTGYNESLEFQPGGKCIYRGQPFQYTVSGNQITLYTAQGNLAIDYAIANDKLNLTINGQTVTYSKGTPSGATVKAEANGSSNNKVDPSLAGKWCYINVTTTNSGGTSTDECITLAADGSYTYYSERSMSANTPDFSAGTASQNSDSGTWWVEGDRIHYNSRTQGQGSYQLQRVNHPKNKDPMIVLDGRSYVTFYNKAPW